MSRYTIKEMCSFSDKWLLVQRFEEERDKTEMTWVNGTSLRENMKEILFLVHSMRFGNIKMVLDKSRNMYRTQWCCWLDLR